MTGGLRRLLEASINMKFARVLAVFFALTFLAIAATAAGLVSLTGDLPQIIKVDDYKPLLVTDVYARGGEKIGEYLIEKRTIVPYKQIPQKLVWSFLAAEDDTFFEHHGVNYVAILRAFIVNFTAGEKKQGASTITQQVAKTLLLNDTTKTYTRKIREILLAQKMEENLSKEDILYLYLNQIYFGDGAYGVAAAADTYFRKPLDKLTLAEMAILAGLPKAPSDYSPTKNAQKAKNRQRYVLGRMLDLKKITRQEYDQAINEPVTVFVSRESRQIAPFYVETLRLMLTQLVGAKAVNEEGLKVYTGLDYKAQVAANESVQQGLRAVDKRQGYRGAIRNLSKPEDQEKFLVDTRKTLQKETAPSLIIKPDGEYAPEKALEIFHKKDAAGKIVTNIPDYIQKNQIVEGLVTKVDDGLGLVTVRFADGQGLIDIAEMTWARKFDTSVNPDRAPKISKPSAALKVGDVILVKVVAEKFARVIPASTGKKKTPASKGQEYPEYAHLQLEQKPAAEGALLSIDQKSQEIIAMVGGYEWIHNKNEFNRTIQARRQTGSSFKTIVYASALDRGYTPGTPVQDAPLVYEGVDEGQEEGKSWKPHNHEQKFEGDILFRRALIRSLNIPSVKILEDVGVSWAIDYARRLGVFSPLNQDLSLVLGSSSLTLYEMTKVFSQFGRLGQRVRPIIIKKVVDRNGKVLLENVSLDRRFDKEIGQVDRDLEAKRSTLSQPPPLAKTLALVNTAPPGAPWTSPIFSGDPNQLIRPQTAYLMTTILSGAVNEAGGTGGKARALGRPVAGKTGSTNNYFDGWFIGYTNQIATGTWVGFDEEKSLGLGEVGGDTALPIWVDYMKSAHQGLPVQDFSVPPGIVFANIDAQNGNLASSSSANVVRQAFVEGTEPKTLNGSPSLEDETEFLKKDLTE
jgi:penicillin-binding protein 1A